MARSFKTPTMEQNQQAKTALRQAWDEGLLDPLYFYPDALSWAPPRPDADAARLLAREPPAPKRNDRITDQLDEPALDTRRQWYQDISY
ncbi:MAG: hypothetical protein GTO40_13020, partial [Deltaproteobacteria bacterium]|nr:hypothetical protein [Deltaproteobacteria bacterium]